MNNSHDIRKTTIKVLTIIGFAATTVFIVMLATEGVKRLPSAFATLASVAESIREYRPLGELAIETQAEVVNSDEVFSLSWNDMKKDGQYRLSYPCVEGVNVLTQVEGSEFSPLTCDEILTQLPKDRNLKIKIVSLKDRFADIPLTLAFSTQTEHAKMTKMITVVNPSIAVVAEDTTVPSVPEIIPTPEPEKTDTVVVAPKPTPAPTPVPPVKPVIPSTGTTPFIDLSVSTHGVGVMRDGMFVATGAYDNDLHNVIKFEVKNIGTKISDTWMFKTELPGTTVYRSDTQAPLSPGERVEFTLGFNIDESKLGYVEIKNTVSTKSDTNSKNDRSSWTVLVKD